MFFFFLMHRQPTGATRTATLFPYTTLFRSIQSLGATAVWLSPVFKNKVVQGPKGQESAGYHGYWVTDFTAVDPHLGTNADFKALVDAAHAQGMKVYMDILINHTADAIAMAECTGYDCPYRSREIGRAPVGT